MSRLQNYILAPKEVNEAAYGGNLGFEELVKFYQTASYAQVAEMETYIKASNWDSFKKLIHKVLGVTLK